jgi:Fe2+ or Zn2+ uptake regulation protein
MPVRPNKDKCNHCGAIVKIARLFGRRKFEAERKVEMAFKTAHLEVFMACGECPDMIL